MPQLNDVVINDDAGHTHTFIPEDVNSGVASWTIPGAFPLADARFTISKTKVASSGRRKVTAKLALPIVETVDGVAKVTRTSYVDIQFTSDQTATQAERYHARSITMALLATPMTAAVVDELKSVY